MWLTTADGGWGRSGGLVLLLCLLLPLSGRITVHGDPPTDLACPAGQTTWLRGVTTPGRALLARLRATAIGGGASAADGTWRIPLMVHERPGVYTVTVVDRQDAITVAAFRCYVDVPIGATATGTPTSRPTTSATTATPRSDVTATPDPAVPATADSMATAAQMLTPTSDTPVPPASEGPISATSISASPTLAPLASATPTAIPKPTAPTRTPVPITPALVAIVGVQADDPTDPELFEYVLLENRGASPQALTSWQLVHAATGETYTIPTLTLPAGEIAVIWSGDGVDDPATGTLYWPAPQGRWAAGDIAELRDASGHLVSTLVVPTADEPFEETYRFAAARPRVAPKPRRRHRMGVIKLGPGQPTSAPTPPTSCTHTPCMQTPEHGAASPPRPSPLRARIVACIARHDAQQAAARRADADGYGQADLNRVHLTGRLGSEPLLYNVGDHPVADLTLVGERRWRTGTGALQLETTWFTLSAWEELAEHCGRWLHQHDRVYVEGALQRWSASCGPSRSASHTIVLDRVVLLDTHRTPTGRATDGAVSAPAAPKKEAPQC